MISLINNCEKALEKAEFVNRHLTDFYHEMKELMSQVKDEQLREKLETCLQKLELI